MSESPVVARNRAVAKDNGVIVRTEPAGPGCFTLSLHFGPLTIKTAISTDNVDFLFSDRGDTERAA